MKFNIGRNIAVTIYATGCSYGDYGLDRPPSLYALVQWRGKIKDGREAWQGRSVSFVLPWIDTGTYPTWKLPETGPCDRAHILRSHYSPPGSFVVVDMHPGENTPSGNRETLFPTLEAATAYALELNRGFAPLTYL